MERNLLVIGAAAVAFTAGTYPPAARPYRETALKAFAYMTSLPAMRTLVEKGELTYDWLNCMGSSAAALLELADAAGK